MATPERCEHAEWGAQAIVTRHRTDGDGNEEPALPWRVTFSMACKGCGSSMRFLGFSVAPASGPGVTAPAMTELSLPCRLYPL